MEGNKKDTNVIYLMNGKLYFLGFSEIEKAFTFGIYKKSIYIAPTTNLTDPKRIELENHTSSEPGLIKFLHDNNILNYRFILHEGRYYQTHIYEKTQDERFYTQFSDA